MRYRARLEGTNSLPELLSLLGTELGEGRLRWDARGWHLGEDRLESLSAGGDEHRIENGAGPAHEDDGSGYLAECLALLGGEDAEATVPFLLGRLFQRGLYEVLERCCALVSARSHEDRCTAFATLYLARTAAVRGQDQAAEELLQALPREAGEELELERAIVAATLAGRKGDFDRAEHLLLENLHHPGRDRYPHALSNTLLNVGIIRAKRGEYDKALACYYDALELKRRHADPSGVVSLYSNLGACHHLRGDAEAALVHYRRAAAEAQRIGDLKSYAIASFNQGDLLLDRGELNEAGTVLKAAGSMAERLGLEPVAERAALNLCFLEALSGTPQGEALRRLGEAETTARARGHVEQELLAIVLQGKTLQAHGNLGAAVADYRRALRRALEIRHSRLIREIDRLLSDAERAAATAAAPEVPGEPSGGGVPSKAVTLDGAEASDGLLLVWNSSRVLRETQPEPERLRDLLGYFTEVLGFARAAYVVREAAGQWTGLGLGYDGGQILELGQKLPLEGLLRPGPYPRLVGNLELLEGLTEEVDGSRFGLKTVLVAWFPALLPRGLYLDHRFLAPAGFLTPAKRALLESVLGLLTQGWTGPGGLPPSPGNREALVQPPQSSRERTVALLSRSITFSLTDRVLGREPQRIGQLGYLVGTSRPLEDLYRRMEQVAPTDVPVLLLGESGVGKEVVARGLHDLSGRRDHSLVIQNCAAIPEALAESILFGHVKGAFTGAHEDRAGVLAEADRGTLFLDEVGELPLPLQATLLRVLQDRRVRPVGGQGERAVDFRLLAATNRPLRDLVEGGTFREDLYFRLQVVVLRVPPLRERREDIPLLVEYFNTTESQALGLKALTFSTGAMEVLLGHPWPGNVRELKNVINRLLVFSQGARVDAEQVGRQFECDRPPRETAMREASGPLRQYLQRKERAYIEQTLEQTQGNVTVAAERLGMSRVNLYGRLRALGLPLPERGGRGKKDR
ncbi:MAG: hypothetical protein A2284_02065 [Deltaproteobacteria bacterium RIFOXYA12_FULL_61_11]|nr:MAG: hypothetical protein A2284_02065 [Deltaproteobacteria bacterium RIFOXYA12_FULL_61_11]